VVTVCQYNVYVCVCAQRLEAERLAKEEAERLEAERQAKLIREEEEKLERKKVLSSLPCFFPFLALL